LYLLPVPPNGNGRDHDTDEHRTTREYLALIQRLTHHSWVVSVFSMSDAVPPFGVRIVRAGVRLNHGPDYVVDRPHGTGDWLFVQFLTPILFLDEQGERPLPPGTCVLYSPGSAQRYRPLPGRGYRNNWCHFAGPGAAALVARCAPPVDHAICSSDAQSFGRMFTALVQELTRRQPHWPEATTALLTQILVAFTRRAHDRSVDHLDEKVPELTQRLRDLRHAIHNQLTKRWTIAQMATLMQLSPSRFAHCYRALIGTSPMDDLLDARIARAADLLRRPAMLVKTASLSVGFRDQRHFSKSFRARMGCTPAAYARVQSLTLP